MKVVRTHLEMRSPEALRPAVLPPGAAARLERLEACPVSFFRYLYDEVGGPWSWLDRRGWSEDEIRQYLARPGVSLWLLSVGGAPAGYFELAHHPDDGSVEIVYFGLLPEFIGRGLGGWLLSEATRRAWDAGAARVTLHTCTLDHPAALPNYLARGFTVVRDEAL